MRSVYVCREFPHDLTFPSARVARRLALHGHLDVVARQGEQRTVDGTRVHIARRPATLLATARRLRPDLVFYDNPSGELALVGCLPGAKHWLREPVVADTRLGRAVRQSLVSRAHLVGFTNPASPDHWEVTPPHRHDVLYPVDVEAFSQVQARNDEVWRRFRLPVPAGPVLLCVANLYPVKRQPEIVEALAPLLQERPGALLVFVGHPVDPDTASAIDRAIARNGLEQQALRLGGVNQLRLRQLLAWADACVINSRSETQCLSLYECVAAGVPVLLPDVASLTRAFPALPVHRDGAGLLRNARLVLSDTGRARQAVRQSRLQVQRADLGAHDQGVEDALRALGLTSGPDH